MPRILVNCPSSHLPVATGQHAPGIDLTTLIGEHAFRCHCGAIHVWEANGAWVEDGRSLAKEVSTELAQLRTYLFGAPTDDFAFVGSMTMEGHGTRLWRECLLTPW